MAKLVILESPGKVKSVQQYLGPDFVVASSMGHVRDLPPTRIGVDVKQAFLPTYIVLKDKEKLIKDLQSKAAKCSQVFLATDPDREGEAISWHLANVLNLDLLQVNRVTFNEITKTGVLAGMANPRCVDMDLVNAQQARRILDRLVGYKLSPFVSQKIRRGLSAGRVQSVALRMVVDRELEIRAFKPEEYWSLDAKLLGAAQKSFKAAFVGDQSGKIALHSQAESDAILKRLQDAQFWVASVKKGSRKKAPAPPFETATLQQEAARKLGFQAQRTMRVAQDLYEGIELPGQGHVGLITYMRTDSLRISDEARAAAQMFIQENYGANYVPEKPRFYKSKAGAQDGHEAIRPTMVQLQPAQLKGSLNADQLKLYDLIWKRFLASQMADCLQDTVKAQVLAANAEERRGKQHLVFSANGYSVRFDGFTRLYMESSDSDDADDADGVKLPELKEGETLALQALLPEQHFTQPPPHYTEASLIKALKENGVGRPSTYATIISTITQRGYAQRQQKTLLATELGELITQLLKDKFPHIVDAKFTANMEDSLDEIGGGKSDYVAVLQAFWADFESTLTRAKEEMEGVKLKLPEEETDVPCDKCGRMMVVKIGRYGRFLACPGFPDCQNAKPLAVESKAQCPLCGKPVVQRKMKKTGRVFYGCSGYPTCEFVTWDAPSDETCPHCQSSLFKQRDGVLKCHKAGCGFSKREAPKHSKGAK